MWSVFLFHFTAEQNRIETHININIKQQKSRKTREGETIRNIIRNNNENINNIKNYWKGRETECGGIPTRASLPLPLRLEIRKDINNAPVHPASSEENASHSTAQRRNPWNGTIDWELRWNCVWFRSAGDSIQLQGNISAILWERYERSAGRSGVDYIAA